MTTDEKLRYIESFRKLVVNAITYEGAYDHCNYLRGMISAWCADKTLDFKVCKALNEDLDTIMAVKRNIPKTVKE